MSINSQQKPATPEEIWKILRETSQIQRETTQKMKETEQQIKEKEQQMKEEADRRFKETEQRMKETEQWMKETEKQLRKTDALFNSQWSKLVESLVEGKLVDLLQSRGIDVSETGLRIQGSYTDRKGELHRREIDIMAANGSEAVAVEVKTSLKPDDVRYFIDTLKIFKHCFPRYNNEKVYGAVAYLRSDAKAALFAERQGLFVIRATGDSASIINKKDFKPKGF
ncbi:MAG: hypothetical protein OXB86_06775 [Bdellovibrionales bacterium]|nr:hypothetical protein [Bdellovibrionales bacterium]